MAMKPCHLSTFNIHIDGTWNFNDSNANVYLGIHLTRLAKENKKLNGIIKHMIDLQAPAGSKEINYGKIFHLIISRAGNMIVRTT